MLPYHTVFVLQQERLSRYQGEAKRSASRGSGSGLVDSVTRALGLFAKRVLVRPAI